MVCIVVEARVIGRVVVWLGRGQNAGPFGGLQYADWGLVP